MYLQVGEKPSFDYAKYYGVPQEYMGLDATITDTQRATVNNKVVMIDRLSNLSRQIESLINLARRIPVEDSENHAELVALLQHNVTVGVRALWDADDYAEGGIKFNLHLDKQPLL